jgi:hypothetical protein
MKKFCLIIEKEIHKRRNIYRKVYSISFLKKPEMRIKKVINDLTLTIFTFPVFEKKISVRVNSILGCDSN